jgi:amidase
MNDFGKVSTVGRMGWSIAFLAIVLTSGCGRNETGSNEEVFPLLEASIEELATRMESGELSSEAITRLYLERIEKIDRSGPSLNSVIELNPDALSIAKAMDEERRQGKARGALHGIPVMLKDNIDTADRMMTTAGALALEGNYAKKDAFLVERLRASGAVILGKTNLSEWANFRSSRSSSGWSSRGGQTRNPYVLDRNPCGSSSGSGAAVSANLCAVAIGTETNGSIVCPSSANGIVGLKPTVGLVSRSGIIPISYSQDSAGPMGRSVADVAHLLGAIAGVDDADGKSAASREHGHADYSRFLDPEGLKGKRIGVWKSKWDTREDVKSALGSALQALSAAGAELVELDSVIDDIRELYGQGFELMQYEFKDGVNEYLAKASPSTGVRSLGDVIAYNYAHAARTMPYFKMETLESSEEKAGLDDEAYLKAKELVQTRSREGIENTMEEHRLDAILSPTGGPAWCTDLINGDHFGLGSSSPAAWAGYPIITVPAGSVEGLPIGVSFFGRAWSEGELISIAYAFEQVTEARRVPEFMDSIDY